MPEMNRREFTIRLRRSVGICTDNPEWVSAIKWKPILAACEQEWLAAVQQDDAARRARGKEVAERNDALRPLTKAYARWRLACLAVDPSLMLAEFRANNTGADDFAINLDALMDHVEQQVEGDVANQVPLTERRYEFAEEALAELRPLRAAFDKEAAEADGAKKTAEDSALLVAGAEAKAFAAFTTFRKLVRSRFGDDSAEARELRNPPATRSGKAPPSDI